MVCPSGARALLPLSAHPTVPYPSVSVCLSDPLLKSKSLGWRQEAGLLNDEAEQPQVEIQIVVSVTWQCYIVSLGMENHDSEVLL